MKTKQMFATAVLALLVSVALVDTAFSASADSSVSHSLFRELLHQYVAEGRVNYAGFKSEEAKLDRYLDRLQDVDPNALSRNEQFAFYINVYNAWTIKLILTKYPGIDSIKELGIFNTGPWKKQIVRLNGKTVSLDHIEHDILRPRYKDPRVHFAINCAALSCPPLRSEPFVAEKLDRQLDDATRAFINNPASYRLEGRNLHVSRIFKWFSEDFNDDPLSFYLKYANPQLKKKLENIPEKINIEYLAYDWSLNGQ
jgi:hypothetical protein